MVTRHCVMCIFKKVFIFFYMKLYLFVRKKAYVITIRLNLKNKNKKLVRFLDVFTFE